MTDSKVTSKIADQVGDLPALPSVVSEVLRLTEDPNTATSDVSKTVEKDPALAAKVLRVSNSSYYGMKQYVGTLKLALVILGVREVRNIVLGISVFETLSTGEGDLKMAQEIWNQSLCVAGLSKKLSTAMGLGLQGEEFISGLLTDIGKMALCRQLSDGYRDIYREFKDNTDELLAEERKALGFTHAEVAAALSMRWNLPETLTDALWHQYPAGDRGLRGAKDPKLAALIRIAKRATLDDFSAKEAPRSLRETEAWEILDSVRRPIPEEERRAKLEEFLKELEDAPQLPL